MNTVPIIKSFIQTNYLAQTITANYGLPDVDCQLIKGTMRDVYHVWSAQ